MAVLSIVDPQFEIPVKAGQSDRILTVEGVEYRHKPEGNHPGSP